MKMSCLLYCLALRGNTEMKHTHCVSIRPSILSFVSLRAFSIFLTKLLFPPYDLHFNTNSILIFPIENVIHLLPMYHFNLKSTQHLKLYNSTINMLKVPLCYNTTLTLPTCEINFLSCGYTKKISLLSTKIKQK